MAAVASMDIQLLKRTRISVFVDEALPDILVVTYEFGVKIFKGVLLDSTKKNLPCGIQTLNPAFKAAPKPTKPDDDTLFSVNQRFTYSDPNTAKKKNVQIPSKYKNNKMTVRLRPRQVLCSKCKGICNENSENVSRKRKAGPEPPATTGTTTAAAATTTTTQQDSSQSLAPPTKRGQNAPVTRSYAELNNKKKFGGEATLIPKLTRLTAQEELNALSGNISKILEKNLQQTNKNPLNSLNNRENLQIDEDDDDDIDDDKKHSVEHSDDNDTNSDETEISAPILVGKSAKRILRKKRSVGSMEDLWDESILEDNKHKPIEEQQLHLNTRTIKISYGPQGEGTVLKIPAQIENLDDAEENVNIEEQVDGNKNIDDKAARRALKKAKKEAKKKVVTETCYLGNASPRYGIGSSSPRYTVGSASPRHGLGNNSPRYICSYENVTRRRKHKVKHKKKHREDKDRKHKEGEVSSTQEDPKECVTTQKLSINLKRLNNTYTSCSTSIIENDRIEENTSSSDEHSDQVPDFPPPNPPLMLQFNSQTLTNIQTADGGRMLVGDVVWGKLQGFPWWPGKLLTITNCANQGPQAHVAWYGSTTSSVLQCDQISPYLENFKVRYNKKRRGPYKDAIKEATIEAQENAELRTRQPLGNSPSHNIMQVVPPALASPREIDVVS